MPNASCLLPTTYYLLPTTYYCTVLHYIVGLHSLLGRVPPLGTLKHIFQKNAIEFETRATSNEQRDTSKEDNLHDSVCNTMRFRIFTEISV